MSRCHPHRGSAFDRARFGVLVLALCALAARQHAAAQRVFSTIDLGTASMRYADSIGAAALSVSPALRVDWTQATLRAAGTFAQLGSHGWSTQGTLGLSSFTPSISALSGEFALSTGGSAHWDGARTGQTLGVGRLHFDVSNLGLWTGTQ
jgi:hypothetical protein